MKEYKCYFSKKKTIQPNQTETVEITIYEAIYITRLKNLLFGGTQDKVLVGLKDYDRPVKLDQFDDAYIMPIQRHFPIGKLFFEITNLNATAIDITMCVEGYQETKRDIRQEDFKTPRIAWVSSVTLPAHTENNDIYFEIKDDIIIQEIGFSGNVEDTMVMNIFRENRNGESIWKEKIPITLLKKGLFPFHSPDGIINYNAYLVFEKSERLRFEIENKSDVAKQLDVFLKGREREPNNK